MPHIPKCRKMCEASEIALLGRGIVLMGLVTGIIMFRGYFKRAPRRHRQVRPSTVRQAPEPGSVRREAPNQREIDKGIIIALIGSSGVILASFISAVAVVGVAYISRSAAPGPSTPTPHSWAFPSHRGADSCRDDGQRERDLLRPRAGGPGWPVHFSCPEAPQWGFRVAGDRSVPMAGRAAVLGPLAGAPSPVRPLARRFAAIMQCAWPAEGRLPVARCPLPQNLPQT
jgi:hypothetical protein